MAQLCIFVLVVLHVEDAPNIAKFQRLNTFPLG
jgi:hypothetical protein